MGLGVRSVVLISALALMLASCSAQTPANATVGLYRGRNGAEVQLDRNGRGIFRGIPAEALLGEGGPVSGPIEWSVRPDPGSALDVRFYGTSGIRPGSYEDFGMSATYQPGQPPRLEFTIGDPDEGHHLVLTLVDASPATGLSR
jgi:hypothetical protein